MSEVHNSVLLNEVIEGLAIRPDGIYIDTTFGRGGHSAQILSRLGKEGRLLAIDKDPESQAWARQHFSYDERFVFYFGSFSDIWKLAADYKVVGRVNGVLLDLGVSMPQLLNPTRGFSFLYDGPLDMRMNPQYGITAAQWLAKAKRNEIAWVLKTYGEERFATRIARFIDLERRKEPITTTGRLAHIISQAKLRWEKHKHPATRSFQAIRIFINQELEELESCLQKSLKILDMGGRIGVISFHSLEDRTVKHFIQRYSQPPEECSEIPSLPSALKSPLKSLGSAIRPQAHELIRNRSSRSAVLRLMERVR